MVWTMEITACPNCGSKNIGIGTLGDGIISGLSSWKEVCRDCGYQGASLLFESETEYKKFIDALSQQKKQAGTQTEEASEENQEEESAELTKEKKEILEFLDETEKTPRRFEKKSYLFEFVLAVVLSIVFFIIMFGSSYFGVNGIFSQNDLFTIILYLLGSFVGVLIFFFLLIVFVETIYRSIRSEKK
jgi:transcription elongation factor Elf1